MPRRQAPVIEDRTETCPQCHGDGFLVNSVGEEETCPLCKGEGRVPFEVAIAYEAQDFGQPATPSRLAAPARSARASDPTGA